MQVRDQDRAGIWTPGKKRKIRTTRQTETGTRVVANFR